MLFWLDFHQTQSNLYKWFRMQRHDWSSTGPKEPMLHLSLSPCTGYQLQLASSSRHWCLHIERPPAQHLPNSTHCYESIHSRSLRSASERRLVVPSQRGSKSLSRTFSFTVPDWWNDLPTPIRNAGSLSIFKQQLKTHLFQLYLTSSKKRKKKKQSFSLFIPSLASCTYLNNAWDLVLLALPLSVCLFKINRFM